MWCTWSHRSASLKLWFENQNIMQRYQKTQRAGRLTFGGQWKRWEAVGSVLLSGHKQLMGWPTTPSRPGMGEFPKVQDLQGVNGECFGQTMSWSHSIQWNLRNAFQEESSRSYLLEVLRSVWASLGWSRSLCRIVSQLSRLSSPLPLSGTLELGTRSRVALPGLFHWQTCSRGSPRSSCGPLGNAKVYTQWYQPPSSPGN